MPEYLSALPLTYLKVLSKFRILNKALSLPQTHFSHVFISRELENALVKVVPYLSACLPLPTSFFWQGLMYPRLTSNSQCSWGWPWTSDLPAFTFQVLRLQECTALPVLSRAWNPTQGIITHAQQPSYQLSHIPSPQVSFWVVTSCVSFPNNVLYIGGRCLITWNNYNLFTLWARNHAWIRSVALWLTHTSQGAGWDPKPLRERWRSEFRPRAVHL